MIERIESDLHKDAETDRSKIYAADLEISCKCTLREFFYGSTKTLNFERVMTHGDGLSEEVITVQKEVEVKPGMKPGTVLRFVGEGNKPNDRLRGDLLVTIEEADNGDIRRVGDNLIYRHTISLADALSIAVVEF